MSRSAVRDAGAESAAAGYGLPTLVALVVTGMIGSGVFTTSGFAIGSLGSPLAVLAAWAVGGLVACCGAIAYAALAFRLPQSGGEYLYLSRSLHPFFGFLAGVVSLTAGFSGAIAFAALTCQAYAGPLLALPDWLPPQAFATAVVLICGLVHLEAGRLAAGLNTALVALKLLAIGGLIAWGYAALPGGQQAAAPVASAELSLGSFAMTVMWIMFSYTGFNEAVYIASEAQSPRRTVPLAVLLGTLLVTAVYLLLNDVFLRSAPPAELAGQAEVAAVAAAALGGPRFEWWMRLAIVLSTLSAAAGMTMAGSRVVVAMADDRILPSWLAGRTGRSRAVLLQSALAVGLVQLATIRDLLGYLGVTLSLCSALTVATLLLPGARRGGGPAVRTSAAVLVAAGLYVIATLTCVGLMCLHDPRQLVGTAAIVVLSAVGFMLCRAGGKQSQGNQNAE